MTGLLMRLASWFGRPYQEHEARLQQLRKLATAHANVNKAKHEALLLAAQRHPDDETLQRHIAEIQRRTGVWLALARDPTMAKWYNEHGVDIHDD